MREDEASASADGSVPPLPATAFPASSSATSGGGVDLASLEVIVRREKLQRLIVVTPARERQTSYLEAIYAENGRSIPEALRDWEDAVDDRCDAYRAQFDDGSLLEINLVPAVFVFDRTHERVVIAYGSSTGQVRARDANRIRQFPDVNVGVKATMGDSTFEADRGHFLSHAAGGELDINLFPHRRELNRGWSPAGARFRRMERYAASNAGTFHYHRPVYDDLTWIPAKLEYGVLRDDAEWWVETFDNK